MVIANVEDHVQEAKLTERYRIYSDLGNEYAPHLGLNQLSLVWAVKNHVFHPTVQYCIVWHKKLCK